MQAPLLRIGLALAWLAALGAGCRRPVAAHRKRHRQRPEAGARGQVAGLRPRLRRARRCGRKDGALESRRLPHRHRLAQSCTSKFVAERVRQVAKPGRRPGCGAGVQIQYRHRLYAASPESCWTAYAKRIPRPAGLSRGRRGRAAGDRQPSGAGLVHHPDRRSSGLPPRSTTSCATMAASISMASIRPGLPPIFVPNAPAVHVDRQSSGRQPCQPAVSTL